MDGGRREGEKGNIVYERDQFRLFIEGETGTRLFLGNAYQQYCAADKIAPAGEVICSTLVPIAVDDNHAVLFQHGVVVPGVRGRFMVSIAPSRTAAVCRGDYPATRGCAQTRSCRTSR
jgi:hypothetical protein